MRIVVVVSIAVLVVVLGLWPLAVAPAWAHDGPPSTLDLAPASSFGEAFVLVALATMIGFGLGRRRRFALALAVALPLLGFEVGVHSAHHQDDSGQASHCVVASATTHLSGTPVDAPRSITPIDHAPQPAPVPPEIAAPHRSLAPHEGRAPPLVLA